MKFTRKTVAAGTVGAVTASGLGLILLGAPLASAATTDSSGSASSSSPTTPGTSDRLQVIKDALAGLVSDGTLTQTQADTVASTLDTSDTLRGGPRGGVGPGVDLQAAATTIGISTDDLRSALQADGATLTTVATAHDVTTQTLVDALIAAGKDKLQQAVTDGRLTQAQADERIADLPDRVATAMASTSTGSSKDPGGRPDGESSSDSASAAA